MKIETVREKWDDEKPDPIKRMVDDGLAVQYLFLTLRDGPNIENMLGMEPELDLLARYIAEAYRESNEMTDAEYEEFLEALRKYMPDIHRDLMKRCRGWGISQEYKDKIDWKKIEKMLPKSFEDGFSIDSMINSKTQFGMIEVLKTVELYLQSGLMMLSIFSRSKKDGKEIQADANLFKKIILTNLVLEAPGRMGGIIRDLLDTEDLANRCLSMLNEHYNQELTIGIMETKMLKSD